MSTNNNAANIATFMEEVQQKRKEFITLTVKFYKNAAFTSDDDYIQVNALATSQTEYYFTTLSTNTDIQFFFKSIAETYNKFFKQVQNYRYSFNEDILFEVIQSIATRLPVINVDEFHISKNLSTNVQYLVFQLGN